MENENVETVVITKWAEAEVTKGPGAQADTEQESK